MIDKSQIIVRINSTFYVVKKITILPFIFLYGLSHFTFEEEEDTLILC